MDKPRKRESKIKTGKIFALFVLFFILLETGPVGGGKVSGGELANFHLTLKDINLANLDSIIEKYAPQMKYDGEISLESDVKVEKGIVIADGNFSSPNISFSGSSSIPFSLSDLTGDFEAKLTDGEPVITGKIKSGNGQWGRLYFRDLDAVYSLSQKKLHINKCEVTLGEGIVSINGTIDFVKSPPFFDIKLTAEGLNIRRISEEWGNPKPISGILFSDASLSGEWARPTTYSGEAQVKIEKGDIGKIGLIGRLITFSPIGEPSLSDMVGDFNISEGYAYTENLVLTGPSMKITAKGNIGWNKKLDFVLNFYASSEALKGTPITKMLGAIVDNFGNILRRVKLTGTIDNPSFTVVPLGIVGTITEGLEKSFNRGSAEMNTPNQK